MACVTGQPPFEGDLEKTRSRCGNRAALETQARMGGSWHVPAAVFAKAGEADGGGEWTSTPLTDPHGGAAAAVRRGQGGKSEQLLQETRVDPGAHGTCRVSAARWVLTWKRVNDGDDSDPGTRQKHASCCVVFKIQTLLTLTRPRHPRAAMPRRFSSCCA